MKNCQTQKGFLYDGSSDFCCYGDCELNFHGLAGWHPAVKMHLFISGFKYG